MASAKSTIRLVSLSSSGTRCYHCSLVIEISKKERFLMRMSWPEVTVVILNWNGLEDTLECLESLRKITYPNYKVVVIDNGSKGNDAQILEEKFGNFIHLIRNEINIGFAGGNNIGIQWALNRDTNHVLLLNNDTVVDPRFLKELVRAAESDQRIGIVGPKIYYYYWPNRIYSAGGKINFWTGKAPTTGARQIDDGTFDSTKEVDYTSGCALLIKEETIRKIGFLNDMYFAYYEETEWCVKARRQGYKVVYVPKAKIWHKTPRGARKLSELRLYYMTRNRFLFMKRNAGGLQFSFFILYFLLTDFILKMESSKLFKKPKLFMAYIKGVYDGMCIAGGLGK